MQDRQLLERPKHLTWEEAACYTLTLATAYRMLFGHRPHVLRPGHNVLVWGASGGLGSFAVQLCATSGANAIGVVSEDDKRDFVMQLGAKGVINRKNFKCWGQLPKVGSPEYNEWLKEMRKFGKAIWDITGKGVNVDCVFEHPGESTIPVSVQVVKRGGMVVICAGTTGYNLTMDARYLWMHQKRVQGSHFANLQQASQANKLVVERRIDPCMSEVFSWAQIPKAHMRMMKNEHKPGNMAVLVSAPTTGLQDLRGRARGEPGAPRLRLSLGAVHPRHTKTPRVCYDSMNQITAARACAWNAHSSSSAGWTALSPSRLGATCPICRARDPLNARPSAGSCRTTTRSRSSARASATSKTPRTHKRAGS